MNPLPIQSLIRRTTRGLATGICAAALVYGSSVGAQTGDRVGMVGAVGDTGIDASGNYGSERAWCLANTVDVARVDCLKESASARAEKRRGTLNNGNGNFRANAIERCEVFQGEDRMACQARVIGYGKSSGSVQGGGILKEIETMVAAPDQSAIVARPTQQQ